MNERFTVEEADDGFYVSDCTNKVPDDGPYDDYDDALVFADQANQDAEK